MSREKSLNIFFFTSSYQDKIDDGDATNGTSEVVSGLTRNSLDNLIPAMCSYIMKGLVFHLCACV